MFSFFSGSLCFVTIFFHSLFDTICFTHLCPFRLSYLIQLNSAPYEWISSVQFHSVPFPLMVRPYSQCVCTHANTQRERDTDIIKSIEVWVWRESQATVHFHRIIFETNRHQITYSNLLLHHRVCFSFTPILKLP